MRGAERSRPFESLAARERLVAKEPLGASGAGGSDSPVALLLSFRVPILVLAVATLSASLSCGLEARLLGREALPMSARPPDGYVDRVEGEFAVIVTEDDGVVDWPAGRLREGDVIRDGAFDPAATAKLRRRVAALRLRLSEGDDFGEDLDLTVPTGELGCPSREPRRP